MTMNNSPFRDLHLWKEEEKAEAWNLVESEAPMNADNILKVLKDFLEKEYLVKTERSSGGWSYNPMDLIVGDEKYTETCGIEIKGDADVFDRLKHQLGVYIHNHEEVYIAVHKHKIPKWLPVGIGVLRVSDKGRVWVEKESLLVDFLFITNNAEWDMTIKANNLGISGHTARRAYEAIGQIRKTVLFNRFFAENAFGEGKYNKHYPMGETQKSLLIALNIKEQAKWLKKNLKALEKEFEALKIASTIMETGQ